MNDKKILQSNSTQQVEVKGYFKQGVPCFSMQVKFSLGDIINYRDTQKNDPDAQTQMPKRLHKKKNWTGDRTLCRDFPQMPKSRQWRFFAQWTIFFCAVVKKIISMHSAENFLHSSKNFCTVVALCFSASG